jgi:hypothetical protein
MKRIRLIIVIVIIFIMCLFIAPSILNAQPLSYNGHYYLFWNMDITWTDAKELAETYPFPEPTDLNLCSHLLTINSQDENDIINLHLGDEDSYWMGAYQTSGTDGFGINDKWDMGWHWVTGESWDYTNWGGGEPNDADDDEDWAQIRGSDGSWNDTNNDIRNGFIIEYEICHETKEAAEAVWVRDSEMKCKQVWINEDGMFQFSFIYPYADNNWVRIYDMSGIEVYSIDMPYDNPNIIVDLPDGMYTVKTFTVGSTEPIQTFVIGK